MFNFLFVSLQKLGRREKPGGGFQVINKKVTVSLCKKLELIPKKRPSHLSNAKFSHEFYLSLIQMNANTYERVRCHLLWPIKKTIFLPPKKIRGQSTLLRLIRHQKKRLHQKSDFFSFFARGHFCRKKREYFPSLSEDIFAVKCGGILAAALVKFRGCPGLLAQYQLFFFF